MQLEWLGKYRRLVEKMVKFGNSYSAAYQKEQYYGSETLFSPEQIQTLEYILENEEDRPHMAEIAERLGMSPSSFSKNVKKMCDKGLLEKYQEEGNRKNIIVRVSDKGLAVYAEYSGYVQTLLFDDIFRALEGVPEEHLEKFAQALELWADVYDRPKKPERPALIKLENQ